MHSTHRNVRFSGHRGGAEHHQWTDYNARGKYVTDFIYQQGGKTSVQRSANNARRPAEIGRCHAAARGHTLCFDRKQMCGWSFLIQVGIPSPLVRVCERGIKKQRSDAASCHGTRVILQRQRRLGNRLGFFPLDSLSLSKVWCRMGLPPLTQTLGLHIASHLAGHLRDASSLPTAKGFRHTVCFTLTICQQGSVLLMKAIHPCTQFCLQHHIHTAWLCRPSPELLQTSSQTTLWETVAYNKFISMETKNPLVLEHN